VECGAGWEATRLKENNFISTKDMGEKTVFGSIISFPLFRPPVVIAFIE